MTKEPALLATFYESHASFNRYVSDLEDDFAEEPAKIAAMDRLRELAGLHDAAVLDIVARHRAGENVLASAMDQPKQYSDEMRAIIMEQIRIQDLELGEGTRVLKWRSTKLSLTILLVNVWIVGLFLLLLRDMQGRLGQALKMQDALQAANANIRLEADHRQELESRLHHLQKMEAIGRLSDVIAHDFKNMIGGIVVALENVRLRVGTDHPGVDKDIDFALNATSKATDFANRLTMLSRKQVLHARPTNINSVILGISDILHRTVGRYRTIDVHLGDDLPMIMVDPEQLETAIINLCLNARDAMSAEGQIVISTRTLTLHDIWTPRYPEAPPGDYVALLVSDNGDGMSLDVAARAFDPFYSTKDRADGLGLSQVHSFVTLSGGHIAIFSAEGRGTTMKLIFPAINDSAMAA